MTVSSPHETSSPYTAATRDAVIVVDLGGTQIRTAVFSAAGTMLNRRTVPTPHLAGQAEIAALVIDHEAMFGESATDSDSD